MIRREALVPCARLDDKGKAHPANVDCPHRCRTCGFNPDEMERRFKTGYVAVENGVQILHFRRATG